MIETLVLHAGLHKTGSSSIQEFLRRNEDALARDYDIRVPKVGGLLHMTPDLVNYGVEVGDLGALAGLDCAVAVISRENFAWIDTREALEKLHGELSRHARRIRVIFYLRRQDSLAVSQKQEGTKWTDCAIAYGHETRGLPSQLSIPARGYLDFATRIGMWGDEFGDENITLRVFERQALVEGDVVRDFAALLGIDCSGLDCEVRFNESLSKTTQLFLHQTRAFIDEYSPGKQVIVRGARLVDNTLASRDKLLPSRAQAQAFYAEFAAGNRALNARYHFAPRASVFDEDFSAYPQEADDRGLSTEELAGYFDRLVAVLADDAWLRERPQRSATALRRAARELPDVFISQKIALLRLARTLQPRDWKTYALLLHATLRALVLYVVPARRAELPPCR